MSEKQTAKGLAIGIIEDMKGEAPKAKEEPKVKPDPAKVEQAPAPKAEQPEAPKKPRATTRRKK